MSAKILECIGAFPNVVWDWNGTLLDDLDVIFRAEAAHFPLYGMTPPDPEKRHELFCFPIQTYYERVGFDFQKHDFLKINDHFMKIYEELMHEAPLFEGTKELLSQVKLLGKRQFILSAAEERHLEALVREREVHPLFDGIFGLADNAAGSKIERGRELLKAFALSPDETLLIGDTPHDLEVGRALGCEVLLVADGHKKFETLQSLHHRVLPSRF